MANNHVAVNTAVLRGASLQSLVFQLQQARGNLGQVKMVMDQCIDGSDYSALETLYGLPAGTGQTVYNIVAGAKSVMESPGTLQQLIDYLG